MIEFKTSSFCSLGDCVEVGRAADGSFAVRDTKDAERATMLTFTSADWTAFVAGIKAGEFDRS